LPPPPPPLPQHPEETWDGVFVSNGPGDPSMCAAAIASIRRFIAPALGAAAASETARWSGKRPTPVFGICLGNQLLALASGASTFKMKYGNRGMNQPVVDMRTTRCFITPQVRAHRERGRMGV
jgi:carbamoylphosphate synthase small subunit